MSGPGRESVVVLAGLDGEARAAALLECCGSPAWVSAVLAGWPYETDDALFSAAEDAWWGLGEDDWLAAFAAHPRIGDGDIADPRAAAEQSGVDEAAPETLADLAKENEAYEKRFGHVFLICATGLSADQMLGALRRRLGNDPGVELQVAAAEQARITQLRLAGLAGGASSGPSGATLSTHVLDTMTGRPASGIAVELCRAVAGEWRSVATATTDEDGRVGSFDPGGGNGIGAGEYRLRFATGSYFRAASVEAFHPVVDVTFRVAGDGDHLHVPLLLSPFGYTTYRGS